MTIPPDLLAQTRDRIAAMTGHFLAHYQIADLVELVRLGIEAAAIERCARVCETLRSERAGNMAMRESFGADDCVNRIRRLLPAPAESKEQT